MSVPEILAWLKRRGSKRNREGMARYAIVAPKSFGVSVGDLRTLGKRVGRDQQLADALWKTGWYEARMLVAFVGDAARLTPSQMDRWARDFDNWAICDALCFHLFDRSPHAWTKIAQWSRRREEFVKRAAFALLASVALHDKQAPDAPFVKALAFVERTAADDRNFVKKGVSWALRGVGRRNGALHAKTVAVARRLAASPSPGARWAGKDALRELTSASVVKRLSERAAASEPRERSAPAKRRARERVGEPEGRSPSDQR
jgi:3-methyladenine DNA glycosylase AlkD